MATKILGSMTLGDLKQVPELKEVADLLIIDYPVLGDDLSLDEIGQQPVYDTESMVMAMQRLVDIKASGRDLNLPLYSQAEIAEEPDRKNAALTFFPGDPGAPYVVICSGGAYVLLTNLTEGYPTAAQMNKSGYNVFVLTYRCKGAPLLPKPQDDVAAAIRYVEAHAQELQVQPGCYAIGGFSAGGHLAASWGVLETGFRKYGLPRPGAIFLSYPGTSLIAIQPKLEGAPLLVGFFEAILGKNYTQEDVVRSSLENQIDDQFPPVFMWQTKEDTGVPFETVLKLEATLQAHGIPCQLKAVEHGDHGLGLGLHSEAEGWVEEALAFWEAQRA